MRSEAIEAVGSDRCRLRVELSWRSDRYRHVLLLVSPDGSTVPLLETIEGAAIDTWPPSPPLQTLTIEQFADGRGVALLLGLAGRSHWSVSIEPLAGEAKLVFDVACRHATKPVSLGSRYRRLTPASHTQVQASDNATILDQGEFIEVVPEAVAEVGTTRWKYVLST